MRKMKFLYYWIKESSPSGLYSVWLQVCGTLCKLKLWDLARPSWFILIFPGLWCWRQEKQKFSLLLCYNISSMSTGLQGILFLKTNKQKTKQNKTQPTNQPNKQEAPKEILFSHRSWWRSGEEAGARAFRLLNAMVHSCILSLSTHSK